MSPLGEFIVLIFGFTAITIFLFYKAILRIKSLTFIQSFLKVNGKLKN